MGVRKINVQDYVDSEDDDYVYSEDGVDDEEEDN